MTVKRNDEGGTLELRLPAYPLPKTGNPLRGPERRRAWRIEMHDVMRAAAEAGGVRFDANDELEVEVVAYLSQRQVRFHDLDNLLKDIFDALQGALGGPKAGRRERAIIPNDHQIVQVVMEKRVFQGNELGYMDLVVRKR